MMATTRNPYRRTVRRYGDTLFVWRVFEVMWMHRVILMDARLSTEMYRMHTLKARLLHLHTLPASDTLAHGLAS